MYTVEMALFEEGVLTTLTGPTSFEVKALNNTELPAEDRNEKVAFQKALAKLQSDLAITRDLMSESRNKLRYIKAALRQSEQPFGTLNAEVLAIEKDLNQVQVTLGGDRIKSRLDINEPPSLGSRVGSMGYEQKYSTSAPTQTHRDSYAIAKDEVALVKSKMETIYNQDIKALEAKLIKAGAPYTPGRGYNNKN